MHNYFILVHLCRRPKNNNENNQMEMINVNGRSANNLRNEEGMYIRVCMHSYSMIALHNIDDGSMSVAHVKILINVCSDFYSQQNDIIGWVAYPENIMHHS